MNNNDNNKRPTTKDDINDKEEISMEERIANAMDSVKDLPECKMDKIKDEKLKKYSSYISIPFFLVSIGFSLFNIGRVRYPLSFLFIALAVAVLAAGNWLRYINIKKCPCSVCETQAKTVLQTSVIWSILALGLIISFIVFMVI